MRRISASHSDLFSLRYKLRAASSPSPRCRSAVCAPLLSCFWRQGHPVPSPRHKPSCKPLCPCLLTAGHKLTLSQAMAFACAIARGLDELHRYHIIACDLKPDNVLLSDTGHAVLADFGIARCVNATVGSVRPTQMGGTFNYMAPEQMCDEGDEGEEGGGSSAGVNSKTDVWALACTLIHMLTGQPPLSGRNAMQIMMTVRLLLLSAWLLQTT